MALPPLPVLKIEALRQAALARLRAAVTAANQQGAPPSALKPLYIPKHRFEKLRPEKAPFLHVAAKSDGGEGLSHQVPEIASTGTLHINIFVAGGRRESADLDREAGEIAQAVCTVLLEDTTFLEQFAWVSALRVAMEDGIARGENAEVDVVLVQIELEMAEGQIEYEPVAADERDLAGADIAASIAPVVGAAPPANHTVGFQADLDPEQ
jgi:hypothetical protein